MPVVRPARPRIYRTATVKERHSKPPRAASNSTPFAESVQANARRSPSLPPKKERSQTVVALNLRPRNGRSSVPRHRRLPSRPGMIRSTHVRSAIPRSRGPHRRQTKPQPNRESAPLQGSIGLALPSYLSVWRSRGIAFKLLSSARCISAAPVIRLLCEAPCGMGFSLFG